MGLKSGPGITMSRACCFAREAARGASRDQPTRSRPRSRIANGKFAVRMYAAANAIKRLQQLIERSPSAERKVRDSNVRTSSGINRLGMGARIKPKKSQVREQDLQAPEERRLEIILRSREFRFERKKQRENNSIPAGRGRYRTAAGQTRAATPQHRGAHREPLSGAVRQHEPARRGVPPRLRGVRGRNRGGLEANGVLWRWDLG